MSVQPKILFSSVFKPFAEADNLYSRVDSKIELFHNQITKYQGIFSPRIHYNTFGLHAIANNIPVPSVVLDFPTLERFIKEIKKGYDYIGIGSITPNFNKVKRMTEEIRRHSPKSKIIIGGFCTMIPDLDKMLDVDYICRGEGISFMRELLGFSPEFEFRQPDVFSQTKELLGVPLFFKPDYHPFIAVGLGCPYGCDFCCPSHFFGKKHIKLMKTGEQIFQEIVRLGKKYHTSSFGLGGDDNFLADPARARQLRELVVKSGLQIKLFLFASADLVSQWSPEELAEMGASAIWIGRESKFAPYNKNAGVNIKELIASLRRVGIKTILSTILLFDFHNKKNIWEDIEDHLACKPTFSQFCFVAPWPGSALYERMKQEGRILEAIPLEDWHAFKQPWFIHPEFTLTEAEKVQEKAYLEEFYRLGPSIVRLIDTELEGYLNMKDSQNPRLRDRALYFARDFPMYRAILKACEYLVPKESQREIVREVLAKLEKATRKTTAIENFEALGLYAFGRFREFRTRHFGEALQPKTSLTFYHGSPS